MLRKPMSAFGASAASAGMGSMFRAGWLDREKNAMGY
jgi:hypothetical protein